MIFRRLKTEYEQEIWNECSRLITNCIIYYNAIILSTLISHKEKAGDEIGADRLKKISPVAWQHINFQGRYEFNKELQAINLDAMIQQLVQHPIQLDEEA